MPKTPRGGGAKNGGRRLQVLTFFGGIDKLGFFLGGVEMADSKNGEETSITKFVPKCTRVYYYVPKCIRVQWGVPKCNRMY